MRIKRRVVRSGLFKPTKKESSDLVSLDARRNASGFARSVDHAGSIQRDIWIIQAYSFHFARWDKWRAHIFKMGAKNLARALTDTPISRSPDCADSWLKRHYAPGNGLRKGRSSAPLARPRRAKAARSMLKLGGEAE
jgi:hypothetical protein